ncbi:hypothetical protein CHS0354_012013 [Potamilus streckersoni]|uniref:Uncharacterized protein n=1 Tax=Potamilus streckersoni TaxID=2493646 RepID=A0AAE0SB71_9BIVA|nr:hypothetical protein CHS0354_012013 [Potamilus streckersoni]
MRFILFASKVDARSSSPIRSSLVYDSVLSTLFYIDITDPFCQISLTSILSIHAPSEISEERVVFRVGGSDDEGNEERGEENENIEEVATEEENTEEGNVDPVEQGEDELDDEVNAATGNETLLSGVLEVKSDAEHVAGHTMRDDEHVAGHTMRDDEHVTGHTMGDDEHVAGHTMGDDEHVAGHTMGDDEHVAGHTMGDGGDDIVEKSQPRMISPVSMLAPSWKVE